MTLRILNSGDAAFTIELGDTIDPGLLASVHALDAAIAQERAAGRLPGLIETMPTFRSLTVFYDPLVSSRRVLQDAISLLFEGTEHTEPLKGRRWSLPVCYEGEAGLDLTATAQAIGATEDEVVALHSGTEVRVYMLGFLPGFPFMGDVHPRLRLPRRTQPRVRVPAGSVAVAGGLTAIYPWESPGGWHLLGRCPVRLFDGTRAAPSLLSAGDSVRFEPVSQAAYLEIEAATAANEADPMQWLVDEEAAA